MGWMVSKKFSLCLLFLVAFVGFLFTVSAAQTVGLVNPTTNFSNKSGTVSFLNASILTVDGASNAGNVSFYYQPWFYNYNGTWIFISNSSNNATQGQTTFNITWNTTAVTDGVYNLNVSARAYGSAVHNGTNITRNITIDNTAPTLAVYSGATLTAYANTSIKTNTTLTGSVFPNNLTLNISVADATVGLLNSSNAFCFINVNGGLNHSVPELGGWCNSSDINITGLTDGNKTVNIYINDTLNNLGLNNSLVAHIDTTAPGATATCSPSTVNTGDTFPCSCSGSDATSGVSTSIGTSTSGTVTSTSSTGSFTYTCSVTDNGGLTASATATYSTVQTPGSGPGGGGGSAGTPKPNTQSYSFTKVTPGAASIAKYIDPELGLKQIEIIVNNEAQSVKITVTKYDGKPAEVSVEKTGKVYQYMQINVSNVGNKLDKAKITAQVKKSWVVSSGVSKNDIAISKFDESKSKWNELPTTYASEDNDYYYYDTEVTSFSYFAISEKAIVSDSGTDSGATGTTGEVGEERNLMWLWIVIAVIVLAIILAVTRKKK